MAQPATVEEFARVFVPTAADLPHGGDNRHDPERGYYFRVPLQMEGVPVAKALRELRTVYDVEVVSRVAHGDRIAKERRYVSSVDDVPEGYTPQRGPKGGIYYETQPRDGASGGSASGGGVTAEVGYHGQPVLAVHFEDVERGDRVAFEHPDSGERDVGEVVAIDDSGDLVTVETGSGEIDVAAEVFEADSEQTTLGKADLFGADVFRVLAPPDDDTDYDGDLLGIGVDFPESDVYVDWRREAFPEQLGDAHVSIYGSIDDLEQATGNVVEHLATVESETDPVAKMARRALVGKDDGGESGDGGDDTLTTETAGVHNTRYSPDDEEEEREKDCGGHHFGPYQEGQSLRLERGEAYCEVEGETFRTDEGDDVVTVCPVCGEGLGDHGEVPGPNGETGHLGKATAAPGGEADPPGGGGDAGPWVSYVGPKGGQGWMSMTTGEVRYQANRPGEAPEDFAEPGLAEGWAEPPDDPDELWIGQTVEVDLGDGFYEAEVLQVDGDQVEVDVDTEHMDHDPTVPAESITAAEDAGRFDAGFEAWVEDTDWEDLDAVWAEIEAEPPDDSWAAEHGVAADGETAYRLETPMGQEIVAPFAGYRQSEQEHIDDGLVVAYEDIVEDVGYEETEQWLGTPEEVGPVVTVPEGHEDDLFAGDDPDPVIDWVEPSPEEFVAGVEAKIEEDPEMGAFLAAHDPEEFADYTLIATADGSAGAAVSPEGDIQNVFSHADAPPGAGRQALEEAIEAGGITLDCYDGFLPDLYAEYGFRETGRMAFNAEYAPEGWNFEKYGEPDVVFMAYQPETDYEETDKYYEPEQWDDAKADSRRGADTGDGRGAEGPGVRGGERGDDTGPSAAGGGTVEGVHADGVFEGFYNPADDPDVETADYDAVEAVSIEDVDEGDRVILHDGEDNYTTAMAYGSNIGFDPTMGDGEATIYPNEAEVVAVHTEDASDDAEGDAEPADAGEDPDPSGDAGADEADVEDAGAAYSFDRVVESADLSSIGANHGNSMAAKQVDVLDDGSRWVRTDLSHHSISEEDGKRQMAAYEALKHLDPQRTVDHAADFEEGWYATGLAPGVDAIDAKAEGYHEAVDESDFVDMAARQVLVGNADAHQNNVRVDAEGNLYPFDLDRAAGDVTGEWVGAFDHYDDTLDRILGELEKTASALDVQMDRDAVLDQAAVIAQEFEYATEIPQAIDDTTGNTEFANTIWENIQAFAGGDLP